MLSGSALSVLKNRCCWGVSLVRTIVARAADWEGISLGQVKQQGLSECELLHPDCSGGDLAVAAAQTVRQAGGR